MERVCEQSERDSMRLASAPAHGSVRSPTQRVRGDGSTHVRRDTESIALVGAVRRFAALPLAPLTQGWQEACAYLASRGLRRDVGALRERVTLSP